MCTAANFHNRSVFKTHNVHFKINVLGFLVVQVMLEIPMLNVRTSLKDVPLMG